jgi:hypothetical protein
MSSKLVRFVKYRQVPTGNAKPVLQLSFRES